MLQPILQLESITRDFSDGRKIRRVLYTTDLSIFPGEFTIIAGPSGSGKTTLLTIMGLILKPSEGEISIQNERVTHLPENRLATVRQQKYGFVFQQAELLPALDVLENVVVASGIQGQTVSAGLRKKAGELLDSFGMGDCLSMTTQQLSGGQKQRVAIARALINAPALLLCDEPTSALDSESSTIVLDALKQLSKDTTRGLIMVTHDPRVFPYADRLIKIENGSIVYDSRPQGAQEA
ncbi:MAG: ABC transporter ATP-binding protein [Deltaproteobacteria bacterium]|jgi:putative ABC transport system ATP-binding protein|nr:ABC transporter ATP-binding protein [Deltaproteobacteria bacterium]